MNLLRRTRLEDLNLSHLEMVLNWRNQDHIRKKMFQDQTISLREHKTWFDRLKKNNRTIVKIFYFDNEPKGVVNFTNLDFDNRKCFWGFFIGDQRAPKGLGTVMGYLALNFIFEEKNICKLCAEIISFNKRSIRYHQRLGFKIEAVLKKQIIKQDEYTDVILMALYKEEWIENKSQIQHLIGEFEI
ncbi:UDP-4-amino-4,6-dideoxy-N-acetyl-beta-L-altrosamine N-acetyltransferase [Alkalihalobacillus sp. BA299]|uniref:UDP-4-amino-4, 6-dideoxy-N-acetyl-beta-L-altrosamine N-acetyltransferase n=1 Tax=Alkalihalobacillus sp. BA299 TaxID=2815938 RepID=UPI001ADC469B|nr:UDP-4-amino-4,6-dideoxy-N-acetyl-beta-L-altrosamine N-acetyltransferase [Alkalihalobacillus sp. BA299]